LDTEIPFHINLEKNYFSAINQGSKVYLPIQYVQKADQNVQESRQKITVVDKPPDFRDVRTPDSTSDKYLNENFTSLSHDDETKKYVQLHLLVY